MTSLETPLVDDEIVVVPFSKKFETVLLFVAFFAVLGMVLLAGRFFHSAMFRGYGLETLDTAQLARNIAGGRGFTTDFVRPVLLSGDHKLANGLVPDFSNSPLQPFLLASFFAFMGAQDGGIVALSMACFLLSSALLFCLARRLSGRTSTAILTTAAFALSLPVLLAVDSAHRLMLSTTLLLALLLVLTPANAEMTTNADTNADDFEHIAVFDGVADDVRTADESPVGARSVVSQQSESVNAPKISEFADEKVSPAAWAAQMMSSRGETDEDADESQPARSEQPARAPKWTGRAICAGLLMALCYLSDSLSLLYVVPLVICWMRGRTGWNGAAVRWMIVAFVMGCLPWLVRNYRLGGNPFASTQWLSLAVGTPDYPGFSVYRNTTPFALSNLHLNDFVRKIFSGFLSLLSLVPNIPNLYLAPFALGALWLRFASPLLPRLKKGLIWGVLIAVFGLSFFGSTSIIYLTPMAPLLALLGVLGFQSLVELWIKSSANARKEYSPVAQDFVSLMEQAPAGASRHWDPERFGPTAATVGLCALLVLPLMRQLLSPPAPAVDQKALLEPLVKIGNEKGALVTDIPWSVAWYTKRRAIWIPATIAQLEPITKVVPVSAVYLSASVGSVDTDDPEAVSSGPQTGQWTRLYQTQGALPEYDKLTRQEQRDIVWIKRPTLDETRRLAKSQTQNVNAQQSLGVAVLERDLFPEALTTFRQVQRLKPQSPIGYFGAGKALIGLKREDEALTQFEKAISLSAKAPEIRVESALRAAQIWQGRGNDARAIELYQTVLADAPGYPVALNNLAYIYSTGQNNLPRALEMARRAALADPTNPQMLDTLGWICSRMKRYDEAVLYLRAAVQRMPRSAISNFHLGMTLRASGKADDSVQYLRRGLDIGLPPAEAKQATALLENAIP